MTEKRFIPVPPEAYFVSTAIQKLAARKETFVSMQQLGMLYDRMMRSEITREQLFKVLGEDAVERYNYWGAIELFILDEDALRGSNKKYVTAPGIRLEEYSSKPRKIRRYHLEAESVILLCVDI